jgi:hypothetical protein
MVAAGDVIELIAKVSVAIVEIDVEEQLSGRDGADDCHASGQE